MKHKTAPALKPLQTGQVWQMGDANLHIGVVGKRLVHYKLYRGQTKRAPISLSGKEVLEKYLRQSKAVLVRAQP